MTRNRRSPRSLMMLAPLLVAPLALAGCNDSSDVSVGSSSTPAPTSTSSSPAPSTTSATSSSTPSTTSSAPRTTSSSTSSSKAPTSSTSASPSTSFNVALASSCIQATTKLNTMVRQWNSATRSGSSAELDAAARTMAKTAGDLRGLASSAKNDGFSMRAKGTATEIDKMKSARDRRQSVRTGDYNVAARGLRNYCSQQLGASNN